MYRRAIRNQIAIQIMKSREDYNNTRGPLEAREFISTLALLTEWLDHGWEKNPTPPFHDFSHYENPDFSERREILALYQQIGAIAAESPPSFMGNPVACDSCNKMATHTLDTYPKCDDCGEVWVNCPDPDEDD
jgi:hypothetical protein